MIFFGKTNPEFPIQYQGVKKKETKKRISQKTIVTVVASKLVSRTKIAYGDFLKRVDFNTNIVLWTCTLYCIFCMLNIFCFYCFFGQPFMCFVLWFELLQLENKHTYILETITVLFMRMVIIFICINLYVIILY